MAHGGARATCPESGLRRLPRRAAVDDGRERQFTDAARPVFANSAFLALHYVPQPRDAVLAFLIERDGPLVEATVSHFRETSEAMLPRVRGRPCGASRWLRGDELSSYLFANVTFRPGPASFADRGCWRRQLACAEWHTSPSLVIDGRPRRDGRGALVRLAARRDRARACTSCPFESRWVTAFHALDPDARRKEIGEVRKRWATKQKGVGAILTEIVTKNPFAGRVDPEAERAVAQLDAMQGELAERPFALAHMNVHVWGETREVADQRAAQLAAHLNGQGLVARQATLNSTLRAARRHAGQRERGGDEPRAGCGSSWPRSRGCSPVTGRQPGHARRTGASAARRC